MVCFKSGCRLRATGQFLAVSSINFFSSTECSFGKLKLQIISPIFLGFDAIIFWSSHVALSMFTFLLLPWIAMVVRAHWARDVAHKSVGENFFPLPWLSVGASLWIIVLLCRCSASHRKSPTYFTLAVMLATPNFNLCDTFGSRECKLS